MKPVKKVAATLEVGKVDKHQLEKVNKHVDAIIKGKVPSSLTLHQLAATGYNAEANKENWPMPNSSSHDVKTSKVPVELQNHYFDKL